MKTLHGICKFDPLSAAAVCRRSSLYRYFPAQVVKALDITASSAWSL
jgi:hypothetical protein